MKNQTEDLGFTKKIGYMCATDFSYELQSTERPVQVFSSVESLKLHKKCWSTCRILEVEITPVKKLID